MFKRISLAITVAALMAGCSSGVKLDNVPVDDKSTTSGALGSNPSGNTSGTSQSGVAGLNLDQSAINQAGPVNVARVIYFDFDSFSVKPEYQSVIEAHANFLKASSARKVSLEGNTDERGGREYNLALGQKRAEAVRRSLSLLGVPDAQVEAVSFGKEKPAAQGTSEEALAQNRRVEFSYR